MAFGDISLSAGMRSNLVSLQQTASLVQRTQERLSTGKKVNSALDDPTAFFTAQSLTQSASNLSSLKDSMNQAIQTINAANNGVQGITTLIESAQGLANSALSADAATRTADAAQYTAILGQITALAGDSGYNGTNLLAAGTTLNVNFNAAGTSTLAVAGVDSSATGLALGAAATALWATAANVQTDLGLMGTALTTLQGTSATLSSNLSVIQARVDFSTSMINTMQAGSDSLTLADMNEEGANMLALQTRQSLGTTALSLSSQANQSVLKLFQ